MAEGDKVFKLIGPALVPQDTEEALANVNTRLEFIGAEVYVLCPAVYPLLRQIPFLTAVIGV